MPNQGLSFGDTLDAIEQLSKDEQEDLLEIVRHRVAERNRTRLIAEVREAEQEYAAGKCAPASPDEILKEILG